MTAATGAEIPVEAPRLEPPVTGLLAQVPRMDGPEGDRWLRGMAFSPEAAVPPGFDQLCSSVVLAGTHDRLGVRAVHPFKLDLHDRCSTWGWQPADYVGRATRGLDVKRHWGVEREFEKGEEVSANLHLAATYTGAPDPTTITLGGGVAVSPTDAMGLLDEVIGNAPNVIGRGMIWVTPFIAAKWKGAGLLTYENVDDDAGVGRRATILSPAGNYVIIGGGFEGRGPAGTVPAAHASQWAYATDLVGVVVGTPVTTPGSLVEAVDFETDSVVYRQEQWFAVLWGGLLHAAVNVSTSTPAASASGGGGGGGGNDTQHFDETDTVLAIGATRNGSTRATEDYSRFRAFASADQAGTLNIQQSSDGSTWYTTDTIPVAANSPTVLETIVAMPYARVQYVNGGVVQTAFELDSMLVAI
jgi:hypothetical protein